MPVMLKAIIVLTFFTSFLNVFPVKCEASEVKVGYGWSINPDEEQAVSEAVTMLQKTVSKPDFIILLAETLYENKDLIAQRLYESFNDIKVHGLECSYAVFSNDGVHAGEKGSLAILGIEAPSWSIGVSAMDMSDAGTPMKIKKRTIETIEAAVNDAGKTIEDNPSLVLVAPAKLKEESILDAIEYVFGKNVRIVGGTPGGSTNVYANNSAIKNGFGLALIYADTKIGAGFHSGIAVDRNKSGMITRMGETGRIIREINNRPAFDVYREWADGGLDDVDTSKTASIWSRSFALVRVYNLADNEMGTKVVVPITVNPDLSVVTGADVSEGENLYFATATKNAYIIRAGTIVQQALLEGKIKYSDLAGGLHYYCRGAAFSQFGKNRENLEALIRETNKKMKDKPYIGTFTAGEQGNIKGYGIFMGNLTSSMAVFGK